MDVCVCMADHQRFANERGLLYYEADVSDALAVDRTCVKMVAEVIENVPWLSVRLVSQAAAAHAHSRAGVGSTTPCMLM